MPELPGAGAAPRLLSSPASGACSPRDHGLLLWLSQVGRENRQGQWPRPRGRGPEPTAARCAPGCPLRAGGEVTSARSHRDSDDCSTRPRCQLVAPAPARAGRLGTPAHQKMLSVVSRSGNANQNHTELPPHAHQHGWNQTGHHERQRHGRGETEPSPCRWGVQWGGGRACPPAAFLISATAPPSSSCSGQNSGVFLMPPPNSTYNISANPVDSTREIYPEYMTVSPTTTLVQTTTTPLASCTPFSCTSPLWLLEVHFPHNNQR